MRDWPMGLVMINVVEHVDEGKVRQRYDVVDGQQRMATLFGYRDAEEWGRERHTRGQDFTPFADLSEDDQDRFDEYQVAVALMRGYERDEILDVYSRLQKGMPLRIGEKIKALNTKFRRYIEELTKHEIFKAAGGKHQRRHGHWNLASLFFKSVYRKNPGPPRVSEFRRLPDDRAI